VKYLTDGTHEISFSPEATEQSSGNALPGTIQGPAIGH